MQPSSKRPGRLAALLRGLLLATVAAGPGCSCDEEALSPISVRLVFPLLRVPAIVEDPEEIGDDEHCAGHDANSAVVNPFSASGGVALAEPTPPTFGEAAAACMTVEVLDPAGNVTGRCRLTGSPTVPTDGNIFSQEGRDRTLAIRPGGDDVSLRVKVYGSTGTLLYSGHSEDFAVPLADVPDMAASVTIAMSAQGRGWCTPFRCEDSTEGASCATVAGDTGPFLLPPATTLHEPRAFHAALALGDGRVLITGGARVIGRGNGVSAIVEAPELTATAEMFDAHTGLFTLLPNSMTVSRAGHSMVRLDADTVLIYGGTTTGLLYNSDPSLAFPLRLNIAGVAGAAVPPAELFSLSTSTFTPVSGTDHVMRALHAAGDVDGPEVNGGLVVVGGVGSHDGDCGATGGMIGTNAYCNLAGRPDGNGENAVPGIAELRAGAAAAVVAEGGAGSLAVFGGNVAGGSFVEFRDSSGTVHVPSMLDTGLTDALSIALAPAVFPGGFTLVHSTLSVIDADGTGSTRVLLYGGELYDIATGVLAPEGLCPFQACTGVVCPRTCADATCSNWDSGDYLLLPDLAAECTMAAPWGRCGAPPMAGTAGTNRTRGLAMVVTYTNVGGTPMVTEVTDLGATPIFATKPAFSDDGQMVPVPGAVYHAAVTLPDGQVLLSGGLGGRILEATRTLLLYDDGAPGTPGTLSLPDEWECASHWNSLDCRDLDPIRCMFTPRLGHAATAIADEAGKFDGMVLITGGVSKRGVAIVDPANPPLLATPWVEFYDARTAADIPPSPCPEAFADMPDNTCRVATVPEDKL